MATVANIIKSTLVDFVGDLPAGMIADLIVENIVKDALHLEPRQDDDTVIRIFESGLSRIRHTYHNPDTLGAISIGYAMGVGDGAMADQDVRLRMIEKASDCSERSA